MTLCFSRYAFLAISLRQDLAAVLDGLEAAWTFFGGGSVAPSGRRRRPLTAL